MGCFFLLYVYITIKIIVMVQVRLEPQELQFAIAAINQTSIMGKDAHVVSSLLKKFEDKLESIQEVKKP
jgi:hypothetical protein